MLYRSLYRTGSNYKVSWTLITISLTCFYQWWSILSRNEKSEYSKYRYPGSLMCIEKRNSSIYISTHLKSLLITPSLITGSLLIDYHVMFEYTRCKRALTNCYISAIYLLYIQLSLQLRAKNDFNCIR